MGKQEDWQAVQAVWDVLPAGWTLEVWATKTKDKGGHFAITALDDDSNGGPSGEGWDIPSACAALLATRATWETSVDKMMAVAVRVAQQAVDDWGL